MGKKYFIIAQTLFALLGSVGHSYYETIWTRYDQRSNVCDTDVIGQQISKYNTQAQGAQEIGYEIYVESAQAECGAVMDLNPKSLECKFASYRTVGYEGRYNFYCRYSKVLDERAKEEDRKLVEQLELESAKLKAKEEKLKSELVEVKMNIAACEIRYSSKVANLINKCLVKDLKLESKGKPYDITFALLNEIYSLSDASHCEEEFETRNATSTDAAALRLKGCLLYQIQCEESIKSLEDGDRFLLNTCSEAPALNRFIDRIGSIDLTSKGRSLLHSLESLIPSKQRIE